MPIRSLCVVLALVLLAAACGSSTDTATATAGTASTESTAPLDSPTSTDPPSSDIEGKPEVVVPEGPAPKELFTEDLIVGSGDEARAGDYLEMHYVGVRHSDGGEFDASWNRGETFGVVLGAGLVIQGWDQGIVGMKEGGRRLLSIPAELAYGDQARGADIPAGSALVFVVDLVDLVSRPDVENAPAPVTALEITVLAEGDGDEVEAGNIIEVHYVAVAQPSGETFASSFDAGEPAVFAVAAEPSQTIPAWDQALVGRRVGDHLRLVIPPELGLGDTGGDAVGPDDTIVTEVKIVGVRSADG